MKRSEQLKITRQSVIDEMTAIVDAAKDGEKARALTTEEQTKYDGLKARAASLKTQITDAEELEREQADAANSQDNDGLDKNTRHQAPEHMRKAPREFNTSKAISEFLRGGLWTMTGIEKEFQSEFGLRSSGILIPTTDFKKRALTPHDTTTNASAMDVKVDPSLSIFGKEPMWQRMGITVLPGLTTSVKINKKAAAIAEKVAEKAAITQQGGSPSLSATLSPERYGISDLFDKELLATENAAVQSAILTDLVKGCDRKLTRELYAVALAAATETTGGALTVDGFNKLMAAVDGNGAFAMDRDSFFAAKVVKVDTGSGRFLVNMGNENGFGVSYDGANVYYSTLFDDGTDQQYVIYGDWSQIWAGLWGALEVLFNPYEKDSEGQIKVTVNRLADMVCRDSAAFVKSPDLDAA